MRLMNERHPSSLSENPGLSPEKLAAHLLVTPTALDGMTPKDALRVVAYMHLKVIRAGTIFIREGEAQNTDDMMLVLEGDILIENDLPGTDQRMVVNVVGPGHVIGEMGLLDGAARSATCTASTPALVAVLTRAALKRLMQKEPKVAAQLLLALSTRMAQRLRETGRKLRTFTQMNRALQDELQVVMNSCTGNHPENSSSDSV